MPAGRISSRMPSGVSAVTTESSTMGTLIVLPLGRGRRRDSHLTTSELSPRRARIADRGTFGPLTAAGATASITPRVVPHRIPVSPQDQNTLSSILACPRCHRGPVTWSRAGWICGACSSGYPVIGEIPWLFPDPRQALAEWRGRLGLLTQHLASEAAAMRGGAETASGAATRRRLLHVAAAYEDQVQRLRRCWRPWASASPAWPRPPTAASARACPSSRA